MDPIVIKRIARPTADAEMVAVGLTSCMLAAGKEVRDGDVSAVREWGGTYLVEDRTEAVHYRSAHAAAVAFCGASWRVA